METAKSANSSGLSRRSRYSFPHLVWLLYNFTRTDIKTIVIPQTFFGLATALSGYHLAETPTLQTSYYIDVLLQTSTIVLWLWINLLMFTLANQRLPSSIIEDTHNKPWRNIPSQAVTADATRRLLSATVCISWILSVVWNVWNEFAALGVLVWLYNDLGGAEEHFLIRNFLNAAGYVCYGLGSLKLAVRGCVPYVPLSGIFDTKSVATTISAPVLSSKAVIWALLTGLAIATTIQVQDLQDQTGDRARSRRTFPLVWGDRTCRWSVACTVMLWSIAFPFYWSMAAPSYILTISVGSVVATRALYLGYNGWTECDARARQDEKTFLYWCLWLAMLYLLPLLKSREGSFDLWFHGIWAGKV